MIELFYQLNPKLRKSLYDRDRYLRNRKQIRARHKAHRELNKERLQKQTRQWQLQHPEKMRIYRRTAKDKEKLHDHAAEYTEAARRWAEMAIAELLNGRKEASTEASQNL